MTMVDGEQVRTEALEAVDSLRSRLGPEPGEIAELYRGLVDDAERYLLRTATASMQTMPAAQVDLVEIAIAILRQVGERLDYFEARRQQVVAH